MYIIMEARQQPDARESRRYIPPHVHMYASCRIVGSRLLVNVAEAALGFYLISYIYI